MHNDSNDRCLELEIVLSKIVQESSLDVRETCKQQAWQVDYNVLL